MKRKVKKPDIEQALVPVVVKFIETLIQAIVDEGYVIVPCDIFKENK